MKNIPLYLLGAGLWALEHPKKILDKIMMTIGVIIATLMVIAEPAENTEMTSYLMTVIAGLVVLGVIGLYFKVTGEKGQ